MFDICIKSQIHNNIYDLWILIYVQNSFIVVITGISVLFKSFKLRLGIDIKLRIFSADATVTIE